MTLNIYFTINVLNRKNQNETYLWLNSAGSGLLFVLGNRRPGESHLTYLQNVGLNNLYAGELLPD